jgi:hypothetical protein
VGVISAAPCIFSDMNDSSSAGFITSNSVSNNNYSRYLLIVDTHLNYYIKAYSFQLYVSATFINELCVSEQIAEENIRFQEPGSNSKTEQANYKEVSLIYFSPDSRMIKLRTTNYMPITRETLSLPKSISETLKGRGT